MRNTTKTYHKTMGGLIQDVKLNYLELNKIESREFDEHIFESVPYEQNFHRSFEIDSMKGKKTRKYIQLCVYRMASGRYELVVYIS